MDFRIPYATHELKHRTKFGALHAALKDAIVGGTLPYGARLPSSRELAGVYGLSRGTVNQVYDMLAAEGYVKTERGSGTFAAFRDTKLAGMTAELKQATRLSSWGERVQRSVGLLPPTEESGRARRFEDPELDLSLQGPDERVFPWEEWNRSLHSVIRDESAGHGTSPADFDPAGYYPLREAIAAHLRRARGIAAQPEQIAIVGGSMQAIAIIAQLLVDPGDRVVVEEPGYRGFRQAVESAGGQVVSGQVDRHGLVPEEWSARLLFVTPGRQYPTGGADAARASTAIARMVGPDRCDDRRGRLRQRISLRRPPA